MTRIRYMDSVLISVAAFVWLDANVAFITRTDDLDAGVAEVSGHDDTTSPSSELCM